MINRLINMQPITKKVNKITPNNTTATIKDYAIAFVDGLGKTQKDRFKRMLENGILCGMSVADSYGIDYDKFINEVKLILNIN